MLCWMVFSIRIPAPWNSHCRRCWVFRAVLSSYKDLLSFMCSIFYKTLGCAVYEGMQLTERMLSSSLLFQVSPCSFIFFRGSSAKSPHPFKGTSYLCASHSVTLLCRRTKTLRLSSRGWTGARNPRRGPAIVRRLCADVPMSDGHSYEGGSPRSAATVPRESLLHLLALSVASTGSSLCRETSPKF